ncbi:hypothetical protein C0210_01270 [Moraxella catarrhalis]|nr:hypothetical protein [Moraxella catarrhalis]
MMTALMGVHSACWIFIVMVQKPINNEYKDTSCVFWWLYIPYFVHFMQVIYTKVILVIFFP